MPRILTPNVSTSSGAPAPWYPEAGAATASGQGTEPAPHPPWSRGPGPDWERSGGGPPLPLICEELRKLAALDARQAEVVKLRPSDILVASHDDVPVPEAIDFGIARATRRPLTDRTVLLP